MNWATKLFAMQSMRQVTYRTLWLTLIIAGLAAVMAERVNYFVFFKYYDEIALTSASFVFGIGLFFAAPLLFGFHLMSLQVTSTNRQLAKLAAQDPLTGLLNRRSFAEEFETLKRKARRQNFDIFALVIDVDHFKSINDHYGHDAGDRVLTQLGSMLDGHAGASASVARLGGEEFGILKQSKSALDATQFAETLRTAVAQMPVWYNGECIKITVSIGWHMVKSDETLASVLKQADAALYVAKANGRNQVAQSQALKIKDSLAGTAPKLAPEADSLLSVLKGRNKLEQGA